MIRRVVEGYEGERNALGQMAISTACTPSGLQMGMLTRYVWENGVPHGRDKMMSACGAVLRATFVG